MVRKIYVQLIDDISGEGRQETLRFSLEGSDYEIDLAGGERSRIARGIGTVRRPRPARPQRIPEPEYQDRTVWQGRDSEDP